MYTIFNDVKKSGYIISLVDINDIERLNGKSILSNDVFCIPRQKTNETESLIAIKLSVYYNMIQNAHIEDTDNITNCKCPYIQAIRDNILFNFIEDINFLYIKYSSIVNRILKTLIDNNYNNQYILLNIEPKGHGRLERIYPAPIISLPGGTMEYKDNNSFEECAFREFYEETLIDIKTLNYNILYVDKLKCNKYLYNNKNTYHVSYYFSIKLDNVMLSL